MSTAPPPAPRLVPAETIGKAIGIPPRQVLRLARRGVIPRVVLSRKTVRFSLDDVVAALREGSLAGR